MVDDGYEIDFQQWGVPNSWMLDFMKNHIVRNGDWGYPYD